MNIKAATNYLRLNKVNKIYYFHIDHFEPVSMDGKTGISDEVINDFIVQTRKYHHSKRLSLFVRPNFGVTLLKNAGDRRVRCVDGDEIGFYRTEAMDKAAKQLAMISGSTELGFQVHIHHENFTETEEGIYEPGIRNFLVNKSTMKMDEARFDLYLKMSLEYIRQSTGKPLDDWLFVHGKWGLNASDRRVCRLEGELNILRKNGCRGDFTFPAGRKNCDPIIKKPLSCKTPYIWRSYDYLASDPSPVGMNTNLITKNRFFIWNSNLTHPLSSLDYHSPVVEKNISNHEEFIENLITKSPIIGGSLFIKTYAHSLSEKYVNSEKVVFPFSHPDVIEIFKKVSYLADNAGLYFECITADKAFKLIRKIDKREV